MSPTAVSGHTRQETIFVGMFHSQLSGLPQPQDGFQLLPQAEPRPTPNLSPRVFTAELEATESAAFTKLSSLALQKSLKGRHDSEERERGRARSRSNRGSPYLGSPPAGDVQGHWMASPSLHSTREGVEGEPGADDRDVWAQWGVPMGREVERAYSESRATAQQRTPASRGGGSSLGLGLGLGLAGATVSAQGDAELVRDFAPHDHRSQAYGYGYSGYGGVGVAGVEIVAAGFSGLPSMPHRPAVWQRSAGQSPSAAHGPLRVDARRLERRPLDALTGLAM